MEKIKRPVRVIASVSLEIKNALRDEAYKRSSPGETVSESDIIFELLLNHYGSKQERREKQRGRKDYDVLPKQPRHTAKNAPTSQ